MVEQVEQRQVPEHFLDARQRIPESYSLLVKDYRNEIFCLIWGLVCGSTNEENYSFDEWKIEKMGLLHNDFINSLYDHKKSGMIMADECLLFCCLKNKGDFVDVLHNGTFSYPAHGVNRLALHIYPDVLMAECYNNLIHNVWMVIFKCSVNRVGICNSNDDVDLILPYESNNFGSRVIINEKHNPFIPAGARLWQCSPLAYVELSLNNNIGISRDPPLFYHVLSPKYLTETYINYFGKNFYGYLKRDHKEFSKLYMDYLYLKEIYKDVKVAQQKLEMKIKKCLSLTSKPFRQSSMTSSRPTSMTSSSPDFLWNYNLFMKTQPQMSQTLNIPHSVIPFTSETSHSQCFDGSQLFNYNQQALEQNDISSENVSIDEIVTQNSDDSCVFYITPIQDDEVRIVMPKLEKIENNIINEVVDVRQICNTVVSDSIQNSLSSNGHDISTHTYFLEDNNNNNMLIRDVLSSPFLDGIFSDVNISSSHTENQLCTSNLKQNFNAANHIEDVSTTVDDVTCVDEQIDNSNDSALNNLLISEKGIPGNNSHCTDGAVVELLDHVVGDRICCASIGSALEGVVSKPMNLEQTVILNRLKNSYPRPVQTVEQLENPIEQPTHKTSDFLNQVVAELVNPGTQPMGLLEAQNLPMLTTPSITSADSQMMPTPNESISSFPNSQLPNSVKAINKNKCRIILKDILPRFRFNLDKQPFSNLENGDKNKFETPVFDIEGRTLNVHLKNCRDKQIIPMAKASLSCDEKPNEKQINCFSKNFMITVSQNFSEISVPDKNKFVNSKKKVVLSKRLQKSSRTCIENRKSSGKKSRLSKNSEQVNQAFNQQESVGLVSPMDFLNQSSNRNEAVLDTHQSYETPTDSNLINDYDSELIDISLAVEVGGPEIIEDHHIPSEPAIDITTNLCSEDVAMPSLVDSEVLPQENEDVEDQASGDPTLNIAEAVHSLEVNTGILPEQIQNHEECHPSSVGLVSNTDSLIPSSNPNETLLDTHESFENSLHSNLVNPKNCNPAVVDICRAVEVGEDFIERPENNEDHQVPCEPASEASSPSEATAHAAINLCIADITNSSLSDYDWDQSPRCLVIDENIDCDKNLESFSLYHLSDDNVMYEPVSPPTLLADNSESFSFINNIASNNVERHTLLSPEVQHVPRARISHEKTDEEVCRNIFDSISSSRSKSPHSENGSEDNEISSRDVSSNKDGTVSNMVAYLLSTKVLHCKDADVLSETVTFSLPPVQSDKNLTDSEVSASHSERISEDSQIEEVEKLMEGVETISQDTRMEQVEKLVEGVEMISKDSQIEQVEKLIEGVEMISQDTRIEQVEKLIEGVEMISQDSRIEEVEKLMEGVEMISQDTRIEEVEKLVETPKPSKFQSILDICAMALKNNLNNAASSDSTVSSKPRNISEVVHFRLNSSNTELTVDVQEIGKTNSPLIAALNIKVPNSNVVEVFSKNFKLHKTKNAANHKSPSVGLPEKQKLKSSDGLTVSPNKHVRCESLAQDRSSKKSKKDDQRNDNSERVITDNDLKIIEKHSGSYLRPKRCNDCTKSFIIKKDFYNHLSEHHSVLYRCQVPGCLFVSVQKCSMSYHEARHSGRKELQCTQCDYRGYTKEMVNSHLKTHNSTSCFRCVTCDFVANSLSSLTNHLKKYKDHHYSGPALGKDQSLSVRNLSSDFSDRVCKKTPSRPDSDPGGSKTNIAVNSRKKRSICDNIKKCSDENISKKSRLSSPGDVKEQLVNKKNKPSSNVMKDKVAALSAIWKDKFKLDVPLKQNLCGTDLTKKDKLMLRIPRLTDCSKSLKSRVEPAIENIQVSDSDRSELKTSYNQNDDVGLLKTGEAEPEVRLCIQTEHVPPPLQQCSEADLRARLAAVKESSTLLRQENRLVETMDFDGAANLSNFINYGLLKLAEEVICQLLVDLKSFRETKDFLYELPDFLRLTTEKNTLVSVEGVPLLLSQDVHLRSKLVNILKSLKNEIECHQLKIVEGSISQDDAILGSLHKMRAQILTTVCIKKDLHHVYKYDLILRLLWYQSFKELLKTFDIENGRQFLLFIDERINDLCRYAAFLE